jgi:hypothetical protein
MSPDLLDQSQSMKSNFRSQKRLLFLLATRGLP